MDFFEVDAASNTGVDDMERILSSVSLMPQQGTKKIYLIDEAHMLSKSAMSAMLKILEEPNDFTVFLFATTDPQKIIHPVRSRSTQVFCRALTIQEISDNLSEIAGKEGITFESDALKLIARRSNGSVRDSIMLFEQIYITFKTVSLHAVRDMSGILATEGDIIDALDTKGMADALRMLEPYIRSSPRDLWQSILEAVVTILATHYKVSKDGRDPLPSEFMELWPLNRINQCMKKINETAMGFQKTVNPKMLVEVLIYDIGSTALV
jgi:DNA polymerase III subunit gamma/tau